MSVTITEDHPLTPDLSLLFDRHTADMHADTPPESIHMMDKGALAAPGIRFSIRKESPWPTTRKPTVRLSRDHAIRVGAQLADW